MSIVSDLTTYFHCLWLVTYTLLLSQCVAMRSSFTIIWYIIYPSYIVWAYQCLSVLHFTCIFGEWKLPISNKNSLRLVPYGSDNGLALSQCQAIIWTNDGLAYLTHICHTTSMSYLQYQHILWLYFFFIFLYYFFIWFYVLVYTLTNRLWL